MPVPRRSRIIEHLNKEVRVKTRDGCFEGLFKAFDKQHMNLVIGKAVELRDVKSKENPKEVVRECRQLGLIVLRGEFVISISVIGQGTAKHSPEEAAAGKERRRRQQDPNSITFPLSSSVPRPRRRMSVDEASAADGRRVDKEDDSCNTQ